MSLLQIIQDASGEIGLPSPGSVIGNTDTGVVQLLALCHREGKKMAHDYGFEVMNKEATFTATGAEDEGNIKTLTSISFSWIKNDTMWNRTLNRPIFGPLSSKNWQLLKSAAVTGPYPEYRLRGNKLIFIPTAASGDEIFFEWQSKNWIENEAGTATASRWADDTDVSLINEDLITMGVVWRYKKTKGFDYSEEFADYVRFRADVIGRDGSKVKMKLDSEFARRPGIYIPDGSFSGS